MLGRHRSVNVSCMQRYHLLSPSPLVIRLCSIAYITCRTNHLVVTSNAVGIKCGMMCGYDIICIVV